MSEFLHFEPCPNCKSDDNLSVWDDGHKWCFGCRYFEAGDKQFSVKGIQEKLKQEETKESVDGSPIHLPNDFTYSLPKKVIDWLRKYDVNDREILQHRLGYSAHRELLIFPVFDGYFRVRMWQGRYFGDNPKHPKYLTEGERGEVLYPVGHRVDPNAPVVVVEDLVSAIRVGRQVTTVPLMGSDLNTVLMSQMSKRFKHLLFWLDRNKAIQSTRLRSTAWAYFNRATTIITDKDPKEYSDAAIATIIRNHL